MLLELHPSLSHVHLLMLQQLLCIHKEAPTLQTLVVLTLADARGLSIVFLDRVDLLVDQNLLQGAEELLALAAHVLVLHIHVLCLLLAPFCHRGRVSAWVVTCYACEFIMGSCLKD